MKEKHIFLEVDFIDEHGFDGHSSVDLTLLSKLLGREWYVVTQTELFTDEV